MMNFNYRLTNRFIRRYFSQKKAREGGRGSGHWGHKGRPKKRGGSAPGGGVSAWLNDHTASESTRRHVEKFWNKHYPDVNIAGFMTDAYELEESFSGLTSEVKFIGLSGNKLNIVGEVYDPERRAKSKKVGIFTRRIGPDGVVIHNGFELHSKYQGKGFGSEFYAQAEDAYVKSGMKEIRLEANLDVGGYAWAKMGFDFADEESFSKVRKRFEKTWRGNYGSTDIPDFDHPWQLASMRGPDGSRIGKETLLGSAWDGVKRLDPSDEGYRVGMDYLGRV